MIPEDYISATIGKPWVSRKEGPDSFDCWGLVIDSFKKIDGKQLPQIKGYIDKECETSVAAKEALSTKNYIKCQPSDGAIMTAFFGDDLVHVGRCICGGVLHAAEGFGVRFDRYRTITMSHQRVEYYRYADNSSS